MKFFQAIIPTGFLLGVISFTPSTIHAQGATAPATPTQSDVSPIQRATILRSRLESMRRSINSALAALNADEDKSDKTATLDTPRSRLRGLEEDVGSLLSDVTDIKAKQDRGDKYDVSELDKLETAVTDINTRVETGLRDIVGSRREPLTSTPVSDKPTDNVSSTSKKNTKKKTGFFGGIFGHADKEDKYSELTGGAAPGRDKVLFESAVTEAHRGRFEEARLLFNVIITTYPESDYLPLAKLAIADTFYLEGAISSLIQAGASYQDWLTFFPTDPLADDVMLKIAEVEMRQMGLPERANTNAVKAEQRLKVLFQQFPNTDLRPQA
ncbi:MAG: outer membrane protein assembly factor BamD, partial [Pyrinomonadaceae bacterium]